MTTFDAQRDTLPRALVRMCRRNLFRNKIADSTGVHLNGGQLLARILVLQRLLERNVLAQGDRFVGLLLPPTAAGVAANAAVTLAGRVPVNLNFTLPLDVQQRCLDRLGIRKVLTARPVIERLKLKLEAELIYLDDFRKQVTLFDKLRAAAQAYLLPGWLLSAIHRLGRFKPGDLLTVIFTSGSTGDPKGVMLSHENVASNIAGMNEMAQIRDSDAFLGVLPLFHSFGYTCTVWAVLVLNVRGVYHPNPLDAHTIGMLCQKERVTFVIGTPTLLRGYLRRCSRENFQSVEVVIGGAEKMPLELFDAFQQKFGVRPIEGYGCTELSPFVSANVPPSRALNPNEVTVKEGTVGRTIPRVEAKVVDLETWADLGVDQVGMLLIRGPNVMLGYYGQPQRTAEVIRDGWYVTGDVARIDADGFITLDGRINRFAKIGGEMVPHLQVEEALIDALGARDEEERPLAVISIPDPRKGERLVVVHKPLAHRPAELCRTLTQRGLPQLWIPSPDSFIQLDELPQLGTGKLDLCRMNEVARAHFAAVAQ